MEVSSLTQPVSSSSSSLMEAKNASVITGTSGGQVAEPAVSTVDTLSITNSNISVARQVVTQQVNLALEITSAPSSTQQSDNGYDNHVGNLVNNVLQKINNDDNHHSEKHHHSDESQKADVTKSIQLKVDQGFSQSRFILNELGIMDSSVDSDVAQTQSQVNQAINQVATQPSTQTDSMSLTMDTESASLNAASVTRELNTSLQVTTKEGDVVTINISRGDSLSAGSFQDSGGSLQYASASSSSQLSISVEGELSHKESRSISKVVERVSQLAEKLFNGETADAMEQLSELNINTRQLSGLALSMSSNISYEAVSAYTQVSQMTLSTSDSVPATNAPAPQSETTPPMVTDPANTVTADSTVTISDQAATQPTKPATMVAVDIAGETEDLVSEISDSDSFENPFKEIHKLFDQFAEMFSFEQNNSRENTRSFIKDLFHDLVDQLEDKDRGRGGDRGGDRDRHRDNEHYS